MKRLCTLCDSYTCTFDFSLLICTMNVNCLLCDSQRLLLVVMKISCKVGQCGRINKHRDWLSECIAGMYGPGCSKKCMCQNSAECDHISGACICSDGWRGLYCDKACPQGFYGTECRNVCNCANGATCDHVTGECHCPPGWEGDFCRRRCPDGRWGQDCLQSCTCRHGAQCDGATGRCICRLGWRGAHCEESEYSSANLLKILTTRLIKFLYFRLQVLKKTEEKEDHY